MALLINDQYVEERLIAERREKGLDHRDEIWDGVYFMSPSPNDLHQDLAGRIYAILLEVIQIPGLGEARFGLNVTDRADDWTQNYRCPDVAVYLNENPAENRSSHWLGGPDLAVEIVSKHDRSYEKLDFYAKVNTREVIILDRDPWKLVLYRLGDGELKEVATSTVENGVIVTTESVPLNWELITGEERPAVKVRQVDEERDWVL
ncbi:Uma2 family endonuclease [Calycomorphotria hydatis]|uniref:Putative restriction endonuclease domain-containing protein n=1 Tax=Calycomorphotria hydatis TaxID=2528027 RepID=A0A517TF06_9PLAN|nr:Uma2 family endonuclease [Calycomorphotria hydatis]QDT66949.1 hypothetical protein V22_42210 [Calycomorphotria hydatis]